MHDFYLLCAAGIGFIFIMSCLGSASVLLWGRGGAGLSRGIMGFSAGVMSAASVWSLLIPAMEQTAEQGTLPLWLPAVGGIVLGAAFVSALELLPRSRQEDSLLFAAITLHNIPEGMAVGLAFAAAGGSEQAAGALALAFGIGVQNFPEGAALCLPMARQGRGRALLRGTASASVEPVFALAALLLPALLYPAMPWLMSFSAGAMLFVSVRELLPEAKGLSGAFGYISGFTLMMLLDTALG